MTTHAVAVVGGGQLARMMQPAAIELGIELRVLVEAPTSSAAQVIPRSAVGAPGDVEVVLGLARGASVLTFEHEHIPAGTTDAAARAGIPVRPAGAALALARDKIAMREALTAMGVPCPRWAAVWGEADVDREIAAAGGPVVVKTPLGGYDGKGVRVARSGADVADWFAERAGEALGSRAGALLVEELVPFDRELAVLVARRPGGGTGGDGSGAGGGSGQMVAWPVAETRQHDGVCAEVVAPAPGLDPALAAQATEIARRIAARLDVTGVLAVEMFEVNGPDGGRRVLVNELAMRPHNSGHWTIDGAVTSQFEQHLRAVLDLPLGPAEPLAPAAVMVNLLGSELDDPGEALAQVLARFPGVHVHLYGKEVRPRRKLGHVTAVGEDVEELLRRARAAVALLRGEGAATGQ